MGVACSCAALALALAIDGGLTGRLDGELGNFDCDDAAVQTVIAYLAGAIACVGAMLGLVSRRLGATVASGYALVAAYLTVLVLAVGVVPDIAAEVQGAHPEWCR